MSDSSEAKKAILALFKASPRSLHTVKGIEKAIPTKPKSGIGPVLFQLKVEGLVVEVADGYLALTKAGAKFKGSPLPGYASENGLVEAYNRLQKLREEAFEVRSASPRAKERPAQFHVGD